MDQLTPLFSLGVGGMIAAIVLYWHRQDTERHIVQLIELNGRVESLTTKVIATLEATAGSMSRLSEQIAEIVSVSKLDARLREVELAQAARVRKS